MKRSILSVVFAIILVIALAACTAKPSVESPAASPVPSVSAQMPTSTPGPVPLDEAAVKALFESDGYFRVLKVTPYEGDYVVEVTDHGGDRGWRGLYWVFGETGEKVWLNRDITEWEIDTYRILSHGRVEITTTGRVTTVPATGISRTYEAIVTVDSHGQLLEDWADMLQVTLMETTLHGGWTLLDQNAVSGSRPYDGDISDRYEQLYQARIGVDDISFSFIPSGADTERFMSFFPAITSTPNSDYSFDPATRRFTIRFYNTALESGGVSDKWIPERYGPDSMYAGLYPYTFPKDSIGEGNLFIKSASVAQEGEDTIVTLTLTEAAYAYTDGIGDIGYERATPITRVTFREYIDGLDR